MTRLVYFIGGFLLTLTLVLLLALLALQHEGAVALLQAALEPQSPTPPPVAAAPAAPQPEAAPPAQDANNLLSWARQSVTTGACARLEIDSAWQARYGPCDEGVRVTSLSQDELDLLRYYLLRFQALDYALQERPGATQEAAISLTLRGHGRLAASPENLAEIARWAAQVYERLSEAERRDDLVARARAHLAARLGLPIEQVSPTGIAVVRWPDACLGLREPGVFCAHVATAGYRITQQAGGQVYEYRADIYGQMRAAEGYAQGFVLPPLGD